MIMIRDLVSHTIIPPVCVANIRVKVSVGKTVFTHKRIQTMGSDTEAPTQNINAKVRLTTYCY